MMMRVKVRGTRRIHVRTSALKGLLESLQRGATFSHAAIRPKGCSRWVMCEADTVWQERRVANRRLVSSFIVLHSCLFMSGCTYSRDRMASYGGPIHILFAPCNERTVGTNQRCWWHGSDGGRGPQPTCSFWSATCITASRSKCK